MHFIDEVAEVLKVKDVPKDTPLKVQVCAFTRGLSYPGMHALSTTLPVIIPETL